IVNLDGDGQFNSGDVAEIIQPILAGEADFVTCTRFARGGPDGHMPFIKRVGNRAVTWLTNAVCGTKFTDVSCGFRAYNREAAYRLAQFGRWTYTEECIVYLTSRGLRLTERHFNVRGEREFGTSRVASNVVYFASHLAHILMRAVRDGRPLKFFGWIAVLFAVPGLFLLGWVCVWWMIHGVRAPYEQFLTIGGAFTVIAMFMGALALLADMVSRHRLIHEEVLYLARRHYFATPVDEDEATEEAMLAAVLG
ncbi:MAG: glycosyltransferase family 2 protein, partial [Planctomycetota bacterium]